MRSIKVIQCGYEKEKRYLKKNKKGVSECVTGFGVVQIIMLSGEVREYHGALAQKVHDYAFKNCGTNKL